MGLLKLQEQERAEVFRQISKKINLNEVAIEKDWWVTAVLVRQMEADGISADLFSVKMNIVPVTTIDPEKVFVEYKSVFNASPYIKNTVILEIGGRSMKEPLQKVEIQSFVDKYFSQANFAEKSFEVNSVVPERTFLEKVCLLHEEFTKANEQVRVERMSRHIYDLAKMIDTPIADNALKNKDLFQSIVAHRRMFIAMKDFDYDTLNPTTINIIPPQSVIDLWKEDYEKMQRTMIFRESLTFSQAIDKIMELNKKIRERVW